MQQALERQKEREGKLVEALKEKADLLDIFCSSWGEESKAACIIRLAKKMPKGKQEAVIRLLEAAWIEGYDQGSKQNLKTILKENYMSISKEELAKFGLNFGDGDATIILKPGGGRT